jgi:hypothetical protein
LLFDRKSIKTGKDRVKGKNKGKGKAPKGGFWRKWDFAGLNFTNRSGQGEKKRQTFKI